MMMQISALESPLGGFEDRQRPVEMEVLPAMGEARGLDLCGDSAFEDYTSGFSPPPLHGGKPPTKTIEKEKGVHRVMAYMYASGATIKRIAEETGYSEAQVSSITRQDWFKSHVVVIQHNEFHDDVGRILRAGAQEAVMAMRELASNAVSEAVRQRAAADLLDRFRGKATQIVHHSSSTVPVDPSEEIAQLEAQLKAV
jgi:hypothetical protein